MTPNQGYRDILKDDNSLAAFLKQMTKFDQHFCDLMMDGSDFTLQLEVHGNKGELIHCRVKNDSFHRPDGVEKRVEKKLRRDISV